MACWEVIVKSLRKNAGRYGPALRVDDTGISQSSIVVMTASLVPRVNEMRYLFPLWSFFVFPAVFLIVQFRLGE